MSILTIADRRAVMTAAMTQPDFRTLMRTDPRAAVAQATDRFAAADVRITVIEEQPDAWEFVVPANMAGIDLPAPNDIRDAVENNVYAILRDEPDARASALAAPRAFLADRLNIDLGMTGINVRQEQPDEFIMIVPNIDSREELNDDALDLVAGGNGGTNKPNHNGTTFHVPVRAGDPTDANLRASGVG